MERLVDLDITAEHIAVITLNRPEAANAMSKALLDELNFVIEDINANNDIFCSIITGANDKVFCAGADLKERTGMSNDEVIAAVQYISKTVEKIAKMPMPVIAALNGVAFGGGLELALACDVRIAAHHAKMALPETSLAIIPGAGGTQRLARLIGPGQAKRLIYTASSIHADEALQIGLVEKVVSSDDLKNESLKMAKTIAKNGPLALRQAKKAIDRGMQTDLAAGLYIEQQCYKKTIPTEDRLEGLTAFQEKRTPKYKGI